MKIKLGTILALAFISLGSFTATAAELGGVTFGDSSGTASAEAYWSMPFDAIQSYEGYGDYEGFVRTRRCNHLTVLAGVKCMKLTVDTGSNLQGVASLQESNGELVTTKEVWWLAVDNHGDLRVLKLTRGERLVFEASATAVPPVLFPASLTVGQTWNVLGKKFTVEGLNVAAGGYENLLKLKVEPVTAAITVAAAAPLDGHSPEGEIAPETNYYKAGLGLVLSESAQSSAASGSGWAVK